MEENGALLLVIDDVTAIVEELTALLALQGLPAVGAHDLDEAIAVLEAQPDIRIIACDICLNRESGLEIVERVRAHAGLRDRKLHYVFITGNPARIAPPEPDAACSILIKPVSPQTLIGHFRALLEAA